MRCQFGALVLLGLGVGVASASPPLGCVENAAKQRWCETSKVRFKRVPPEADSVVLAWVHPAFKKSSQLPEPIGAQVVPVPVSAFLPVYFENRLYPIPDKKKPEKP